MSVAGRGPQCLGQYRQCLAGNPFSSNDLDTVSERFSGFPVHEISLLLVIIRLFQEHGLSSDLKLLKLFSGNVTAGLNAFMINEHNTKDREFESLINFHALTRTTK